MKSMIQSNLAGNLLRLITALFCAMLVTACGGGGGSPGNTSNTALFTSAPDSMLVSPGETKTFSISGGVTPYKVSTSTSSVVASVTGNTLSITGGGGGGATVVISDGVGATKSLDVKIGSGLPLFTTAGSSILLAVGATSSQFEIGGGSQNYAISSNNTGVATVGISGNRFIINGVASGKAAISVRDSVGGVVSIDVVVGTTTAALFTSAGSDIAVALGATSKNPYVISGGSAPYEVVSNNESIASIVKTGSSFAVTGKAAGSAIITISDTAGATTKVNVTVGSALGVFPSVASARVGDTLTFTLTGGTEPYVVTSNNNSIAIVSSPVDKSGGIFTAFLASAGTTTLSIVDAARQTLSVTVTAAPTSPLLRLSPSVITVDEKVKTDAPSAPSTPPLPGIPLSIFGGTGPYVAYTSDVTLAPVTIAVPTPSAVPVLTIGGPTTGRCVGVNTDVTITVVDSIGTSATSTLSIRDTNNGGAGC